MNMIPTKIYYVRETSLESNPIIFDTEVDNTQSVLNVLISEYSKRFNTIPIPENGYIPFLLHLDFYGYRLVVFRIEEYNKILPYYIPEGIILDSGICTYTPYFIVFNKDRVHARFIYHPENRPVTKCKTCGKPMMGDTVAGVVYKTGANYFCSHTCRDAYIESIVPGITIPVLTWKENKYEKEYSNASLWPL